MDHSLVAEELRSGFNSDWYREFKREAQGLGRTFQYSVVGVGGILDGLSAFLNGKLFQQFSAILGVGMLYLFGWTLLSGGVLHLYNTTAPPTFQSFALGSLRYFSRFLRLTLLAGVLYWLIYSQLLPSLADLVRMVARDQIDERVAFLGSVAKYSVVLGALILVNLVFDYAKILTVTQQRRSSILAILKAAKLLGAHPGRMVGLYVWIGLLGIGFFFLYWLVAPGINQQSSLAVGWALLLGQMYITSRIWTRLLFLGSQSALCEELLSQA